MKLKMKPDLLKYLILAAGPLGFGLRTLLYTTGVDGRGLLIANHWSVICLWILTVLTAAALALFGLPLKGSDVYKKCYPASVTAAAGCFAAAAGIIYTILPDFGRFRTVLDILLWALGLAAAVSFVVIGVCRMLRAKPYFLLHAAICLYMALRLVTKYRLWSAYPQMQDYCFYLTAHVALMLTAYHHAAFDAGMGKHRSLWVCSLAAVYLSCVSLATRQDPALLAGCTLWAFSNLTNLRVRQRRPRPVTETPAEE